MKAESTPMFLPVLDRFERNTVVWQISSSGFNKP
jgi:hypothetical protein